MSNNRGRLFVISGPSGSGKSSVCDEVSRRTGVPCSVSATTRPPRPGEENGRHYIFLSPDAFAERVAKDWFYEHAEVYGHEYGTPREPIETALAQGRSYLLDVDVQGARSVKERCEDAVLIFIAPPDNGELRRRLEARATESEAQLDLRLSKAEEEGRRRGEYDHVVVNGDLDEAVAEVMGIVESERKDAREV
jgi:guanylate kinase